MEQHCSKRGTLLPLEHLPPLDFLQLELHGFKLCVLAVICVPCFLHRSAVACLANKVGCVQAHWPVRIGRDLSPLFEGFADGRRVVTFAEMEFNKNLSAAGLSLNVRNPREFIDLLSAMPLSLEAESQSSSNSSSSSQSSGQHWMLPASARVEGMPDSRHGSLLSNAATHGVQALHEMAVTKVAAGWACSAALTTTGEVWMFGYSYDRLFANGNAVQTEGRPIDGRPARLIAENGGAIDIVIGFQYCAALARNGSVVLWGKVAPEGVVVNWSIGSEAQVRSLTSIQDAMTEGALGRFTGVLPAMTHLAAGKSQLVMSNGEGVWHMRVLPDSWEKTVATIRQMRFNVRIPTYHLNLTCCSYSRHCS